MADTEVVAVKKFCFDTYDVYLEINRKRLRNGERVYWYHKYAQDHPIRNKSVQPYNEVVSVDYKSPWEVIFDGYKAVEVFERKNKK